MSEKIGIAISVYDKFDELGVLIDIIRENYEKEYYITVCSGYEDAEREIADRELDIDTLLREKISYNPQMNAERGRIKKQSRILDSFKKSSKSCIEAGCEYVIHLHADAWPLSEEKFLQAIEEMEERNASIAVRGFGSNWMKPVTPAGLIMDQFFIMESQFVKDKNS